MFVNEAGYLAVVLAPFGPSAGLSRGPGDGLRSMEDLDAAVSRLAGSFAVPLAESVCPEREAVVQVARLADFKPANIAKNCPWLRRIMEAAAFLDQAAASGMSLESVGGKLRAEYGDLPLDFSTPGEGVPTGAAAGKDAGSQAVDAILDMVSASEDAPAPAGNAGLADWKKGLAALASAVLAGIFADPVFRAAETAWRGVRLILENAGPDSVLSLELVSVGADGLIDALTGLVPRFQKAPPNLILADVFLDAAPARMETWTALAETADALLVPAAAAISPAFFHLQNWDGLSRIGYPAAALEDASFAKWRKLAAEPGGAWLAALFNRAALRPAYGPDNPSRVADFKESSPLWGSPVWALGAAAAQSLSRSGWPHLLGIGSGVGLENLAVSVNKGRAMAVETLLSDDQLLDFARVGLTPLGGRPGGDQAFFRKVAAIDGSSFAERLLFNRTLGFFFRCREDEGFAAEMAEAGGQALADALRKRFSLFFQKTGHPAPEDLDIKAESSPGGTRLAIGFTPPHDLGMGSGKINFSFIW